MIFKEQSTLHRIIYATAASIVFLLCCIPAEAQRKIVDLILVNGNVRTMDVRKPRAEAVAVSDGKIVAVGANAAIRKLATGTTRVVDAEGRLILPGFNDAHVHFTAIGNKFSTMDLRAAKSVSDVVAMLAEYVRFLPKGRWILGHGFDPVVASGEFLSAVDAMTPDNPVFVYTVDGKFAFANTAAWKKAQIIPETAAERTGLFTGNRMQTIASVVPKDHARNWAEIIETASNYAASLGVTSVQDMHSDELADVYRELDRKGKLKTRVYDCAPITSWQKLARQGVKAATGDSMVRTGCVKYFSEGDEESVPELQREISAADRAGLQVMVHAIGAKANSIVLNAFERAIRQNGPRDRRFRIEHAQNAAEADLPRFGRSNIIASMQPWLFNGTNPTVYKRHLQLGTPLAFGSDASITDFNQFLGLQAATTGPGAMSVEEALYAYTVGSAYAEFQEKAKGTIELGKLADFIVLSADVFSQDGSAVREVRVEATFVAGKVVFETKKL